MRPAWDDLNARVRGLQNHLLTRGQLEALSHEPDLAALSEALRREGVVAGDTVGPVRSTDLELAIRRWAGASLRTLARWSGPRSTALPFVFDDEDRRSIRAMLRGAVQHAPAEERLAGLIPTPALPERALEELARAPTAASVVARLSVWRHPWAPALVEAIGPSEPDLFVLETLLARAATSSALKASHIAGDRLLRQQVVEAIDLENAVTAIALAMEGEDVVPRALFLTGGERLTIGDFEEAIETREPTAAGARLARSFHGTPYADLLLHGGRASASLEDELLRARLRAMARQGRLAPLGPIMVLRFALRLRAQVIDLQRLVWTVALDVPREAMRSSLTTVAT